MNENPDKSLNPMNWSRNEKIAMLLAALIGVIIGVVVGYFAHSAAGGASGGMRFGRWLDFPLRAGWIWWALVGGLVGIGFIYVRRLTSESH